MKPRFFRVILILVMLICAALGMALAEPSSELPIDLTVEKWVGHDFIFLALPADKQEAGYEIFLQEEADKGFQQIQSVRLPYAEHFGKEVTITKVVPTGDDLFDYTVYMTEKETGKKLIGRTLRGQLDSLSLVNDRKSARKQFVGKTIYAKVRTLEGVHNPVRNETPVSVTVPLGAPMTVEDVWGGLQASEPIWLVLSVNGQKAALPIAYSWTNQPKNMWKADRPWQQYFYIENPQVLAGGSQETWQLIEIGNVKVGLTKDQVRLSWGSPLRTDQDFADVQKSVWIYGDFRLHFIENILVSIEAVEIAKPIS